MDNIEGNNEWKSIPESPDYNAVLVETRLKQMDEARISCDIGRMLFLIRTSLSRGLGDMGNLKLYKHTHIGTKNLIERYINSTLSTLDALLDVSAKAKCDGLESKYILEQVLSSRQAFGRSALLLSGGATFGMNHIGVIKALWEASLLPRIISGASAGSIVCAVLCTRTEEEMPELLASFCDGDLAVFEEEGNEEKLVRKVARFLKFGALFDISHLIRVMRDLLGEMTFQEAYNRTRKILNICVSSASLYELPRLLNYITAPNVLIWSAVAASCSVPFIFSAATILAKDPKTGEAVPWNPSPQRWIDGSVDNDLPMTRLAEMFNVNHFIVSQVNPHVVPFLVKEEDSIAQEAQHDCGTVAAGPSWLNSAAQLAKSEALHRMHTLAEVGIFPNTLGKVISVLSQKYSGDITIMPEISYADFPRILANPTPEFMHHAMLCGERATWPKLSRIKNHCAIELALDDAVQKLRARVVFSPSQVDLRLGHSRSVSDNKKAGRGRGKIRKRPLSQTDVSDPMQKQRSSKATPPKKPLSINTVLSPYRPSPASSSAIPIQASTAPLRHPPMALHDLTSSGAETSNLPTSASSSSFSYSSPTESPASPRSPALDPVSRSQPATPHPSHIKLPSPFLGAPQRSPTPPAVMGMTLGALSMTPRNPSTASAPVGIGASAEGRYKKLFHSKSFGPVKDKHAEQEQEQNESDDGDGSNLSLVGGKRDGGALEIDVPAIRGVGRGKGVGR